MKTIEETNAQIAKHFDREAEKAKEINTYKTHGINIVEYQDGDPCWISDGESTWLAIRDTSTFVGWRNPDRPDLLGMNVIKAEKIPLPSWYRRKEL